MLAKGGKRDVQSLMEAVRLAPLIEPLTAIDRGVEGRDFAKCREKLVHVLTPY
jgi:hypothetical protein